MEQNSRFSNGRVDADGLRNVAHFAGGPFAISIAIHLAIILALVVAVHESRAREHIYVSMLAGSLRPLEETEPLEIPDVPMPELNTSSPEDSPPVVDTKKVLDANPDELAATPTATGLDIGNRHLGDYLNLHPAPRRRRRRELSMVHTKVAQEWSGYRAR